MMVDIEFLIKNKEIEVKNLKDKVSDNPKRYVKIYSLEQIEITRNILEIRKEELRALKILSGFIKGEQK